MTLPTTLDADGGDPRFIEILFAYTEAREAGWAPPVEAYVRCYPEFEAQLREALNDAARFQGGQPETIPLPAHHTPAVHGELVVLGHGGMGDVYRLPDPVLGRDLALKVLQAKFVDQASWVSRFEREARITGSLTHPGVPPVHQTGRLPDGRPFYTMKLIQGRTLQEIITDGIGDLASHLRVIEQVARTVAAAHAQSIIHRDLKPANIMVGAFEEVQVMDWGLAKVLHEADTPDTTPIGASPETQAGKGFGTMSYAPPEQIRGEWHRVGPTSDVFALGGMLCFILTKEAPYKGTHEEIRTQALTGNVAEVQARLAKCGQDPMLVQLAQDCLRTDPNNRPRDASVFVERLEAFAKEAQRRIDRANAAAANARLKQRALAVGAVLLVALVLVGAYGRLQQRKTQQRQEQTREVLAAAYQQGERYLQQERYAEAVATADFAEPLFTVADQPEIEANVRAIRKKASFAQQITRIQQQRNGVLEPEQGRGNAAAAEQYMQAFAELEIDPLTDKPQEVAAALVATGLPKNLLVIAVFDYSRTYPQQKESMQISMTGVRLEPSILDLMDRVITALQEKGQPRLAAVLQKIVQEKHPPYVMNQVAQMLVGSKLYDAAVDMLSGYIVTQPNDFWLNLWLGLAHFQKPKPNYEAALRAFSAAHALRPSGDNLHGLLGAAHFALNRLAEAKPYLEEAVRLNPKDADALRRLKQINDIKK